MDTNKEMTGTSEMDEDCRGTNRGGKRRLDDHNLKASMDMVAVNNMIVSLRAPVKKARVCVIHKLTRHIKQLRNKKGNEDQLRKNKDKADRLHQEVQTISNLDVDKVAKFSLSNTISFDELIKKPDVAMTSRAMTRLASSPDLALHVNKFRAEHDDWKSLADFILYKNTGRRYRKNKNKRKEGESVIRDLVVKQLGVNNENTTNTSEQSGENIDDNDCETQNVTDINSEGEDNPDLENSKINRKKTKPPSDAKLKDGRLLEKKNSSKSLESDSSNESESDSNSADSGSRESDTEVNTVENTNVSNNVAVEKLKKPESTNSLTVPTGTGTKTMKEVIDKKIKKVEGDMVIKKMSFDEPLAADETNILVSISNETVRKPHRPKSSFFLCEGSDGSENDDDDDDDDGGKSKTGFNDSRQDSDSQIQSRRDVSVNLKERGRQMVESVFVQSLSAPRPAVTSSKLKTSSRQPDFRFGNTCHKDYTRAPPSVNARKQYSHTNMASRPQDAPQVDEVLHPSWEASRKRKEASSIQVFTGKKIKFDD